MRTFFRINNILLIVAMIACCAGALAGLIVLLPFAAGAWALNLVGARHIARVTRVSSGNTRNLRENQR